MKNAQRNRRPLNAVQQWQPQLAIFVFDSQPDLTHVVLTQVSVIPEVPVIPVYETGSEANVVLWDANAAAEVSISNIAISETGDTLTLTTAAMTVGHQMFLIIPTLSTWARSRFGGYIAPTNQGFIVAAP